ncbi:Hypothetical protein, putative [Bodo saltans]|uniref:Uncharacterized protein n=1 Tax=Bodo saltans TaxID=75058 RepID=A0A0S4IN51_BODSA|nr:Hypothetical protein, putative [Bodo saltans]|eukprot:CUE75056.1 Hypothetical protein, putative [Bodo saltans]
MSHQQYRRFARHIREHGEEGENDGATTGYAFDGAANADDSNSDLMVPNVTPRDVDDVFATFSACKNHHDFFQSMNRLWCVSVARSDVVAANVHLTNFQPVLRFLSAAPKSGIDRVLFTSIISWMSVLGSVASLPRELLDCVAGMVPTHFIPMMAPAASPNSHVTPQQISLGSVATPSASSSWQQQQQQQLRGASTSSSSIGGLVNSHLLPSSPNQGGGGGINISHSNSSQGQQHHITPPSTVPPPVALASSTRGTPDVSIQLVSFMIFLEHTCTADLMITWLRGGLLSFLDGIIRTASGVKSILVDSPSTVDGALSDEAYLNCALESSRSELVTLAASACKLLSAVMNNFADLLLCEFPREISSAVELFVPQLLKIVLHNPTLSAAEENTPGSILHHVHRCHRALRSTSIGECAAVSLDACLALLAPGELEINKLRDMMLLVPALTRATKNSVVPHIRACVYRVLIRLCGVPSHLVLMVREMPSILSTAVKCILEVNSAAPQWVSAAAAEWLVRVIAVAALDSSTEGSFDLSQTALTVRLLHLVSSLPIGCTSAAMLALCTAMYEQQERLRGATSNSSRGSAQQEPSSVPATLVLEPYGRKSMQHWSHILLTSANANRSLVKVCEAIEPTRCSTRDVFARALAVYEDVAAQFCHTASAAHGVRYLVEAEPSRRAGLGDVMLYEFASAALNAPSPAALSEMVRVRFGEACPFATSVLVKAHEYMIQAVAAVLCSWVSASSSRADHSNHLLEPLPSHLLTAMIELMRDTTVNSSTRLHLTKIVNSTHSAPHQTAIRKSFSHLSGEMFEASLSLRGDAPALLAMRCRLLAEHSGASNAAMSTGWLHDDVVVPLEKLSAVVAAAHHNPATKQAITSVKETDVVNSLLSSMSSFFSNPGCAAIPAEYTERLSLSWLRLLRAEGTPTQQTALRCIPFLAQSPAGRLTALHEAVKSGDVHARSCLGFAMHWALPFTLPPSVLRASGPTRRPPRKLQKASEVHLHSQVIKKKPVYAKSVGGAPPLSGMDGIAAMISLETDPCARCLMKVRSYEVVEDTIVVADVQHGAPSVLDYKILAAASFCADVQVAIARSSELMTAVLATAEDRPTQDVGVFALLILRNLCFSANLKIQMCQDSRVLFALRNALLCQSSAAAPINPRHLGDPAASPTIALEVCSEVMLRQELAARALWSLTHNNERGKAYVRGALQQQSSSSPLSALPQQQYLASSSSNKHHTATTALRIPSHYSVGPQASDHLEMMDEVIKMLTSQEVIKPAATIAAGN